MDEHHTQSGCLYVVATPIGNLGDLSERAKQTLSAVDLVLAEDTRRTQVLLDYFGLSAKLKAMHDHNESDLVAGLVAQLKAGARMALVSDAGTPLISDPGYPLLAALRGHADVRVVPIPGACAAVAALSVAGLASDRFVFEGFLPSKSKARCDVLQALALETRTLVFYESSHRISDFLTDAARVLGDTRQASVLRELTKLHETNLSDSLGALAEHFASADAERRGEFVVVIAGAEDAPVADLDEALRVAKLLLDEVKPSKAAKLASQITGVARALIYERL